jgi:hypothetical protein
MSGRTLAPEQDEGGEERAGVQVANVSNGDSFDFGRENI